MRDKVARLLMAAASGALVLSLAACDSGASAVAARDHSATTDLTSDSGRAAASASSAYGAPASSGSRTAAADDPRDKPAPLVDGKPMWAATRRLAAQDAAQANFERNGADFAARDVDDWVSKTHAFVEHPPKGVQTLSRANGDTLYYDAKANVFAVATKDGAPRTMFKPRDGAAYWAEQKAEGDSSRSANSTRRAANDG
jgi:pyocin large subunit-like protein